LSSKSSCTWFS